MATATKSTACAECIAELPTALWCSCTPDTRIFWSIGMTWPDRHTCVFTYTKYLPGEEIPSNLMTYQQKDLNTDAELQGIARGSHQFTVVVERGGGPKLRPV